MHHTSNSLAGVRFVPLRPRRLFPSRQGLFGVQGLCCWDLDDVSRCKLDLIPHVSVVNCFT